MATTDGIPSWQRRRAAINHDLLKNQLLPALGKWFHMLSGQVEDPGYEETFRERLLPRWEEVRQLVVALINDFEEEMSPRSQIMETVSAEAAAQVRYFLAAVAEACWLGREDVERRQKNILRRIDAAEFAYRKLVGNPRVDRLSDSPAFGEFRERCCLLSRAIEELPSAILIA